jgi:hypothetical protein
MIKNLNQEEKINFMDENENIENEHIVNEENQEISIFSKIFFYSKRKIQNIGVIKFFIVPIFSSILILTTEIILKKIFKKYYYKTK